MGILGINNRTENWKTVQRFHGLCDAAKVGLVSALGGPKDTAAEEVSIELFWRGMRDYAFKKRNDPAVDDSIVGFYERCFKCLRHDVEDFRCKAGKKPRFRELKKHNYTVPVCPARRKTLVNNVKSTEVDIVLETPGCIFIGEAKDESPFGTDSRYVLVHQLVRQYVTASILVHLVGCKKRVVPFIVTEHLCNTRNTAQVSFMIEQKWLCERNVLTWNEVDNLTRCIEDAV